MKLVLASASPRRRELLARAGFEFEVRPSEIPEFPSPGETPEVFARRAAREKALDVAARAEPGTLVLGADTVVALGDEILGKPADAAEAGQMMRRLSGRTHRVTTAVCLVRAPDRVEALGEESTAVTFRALSDAEIREYVATGEPFDKAGGYGIQGHAAKFVERVEGDYSNVVGLPVARVAEMLRRFPRPDP
jgi:septum formation protein